MTMYNLAAITIVKNEATHLAEWVEFHAIQGVDKFYIYDNHSTDFPEWHIAPHVRSGLVEFKKVPEDMHNKYAGYWMYQDLLPKVQNTVKWMWAGSIDEFMFPTDHRRRMSDIIFEYDKPNIAALHIPWTNFNSSGKTHRESGLVIERFTHTFEEKTPHVKSIFRPNRIERMIDPHSSAPKDGFICVDENFNPVYGPWVKNPSSKKIRLNHYVTMSEHEYRVKISKGRSDVPGGETVARPSQWAEYHPPTFAQNTDILPLVPVVRESLINTFRHSPDLISWLL